MSSNRSQFLDESITHQEQKDRPAERQRKRRANLYDAVAGRVNAHGFIPATPYASKYRDTASSSSRALPPEEVLFRREGMPVRYEETDRYFAHESLPADQPLPSSELLESIHAYTADYYDQALGPNGRANQYSMNGKSLMFMGVLLEELAKESLGDTGDLALVEGDDLLTDEPTSELGRRMGRKRANSRRSSIHASSGEDLDSVVKRKKRSKKRRLTHRASATDIDTEPEGRLRLTDR